MKVYINPTYTTPDKADGGIRRVSDAMARWLPDHGWQAVNTPDEADLILNHGASLIERQGIPMVAACHGLLWEDYNFGLWGDDVNKAVIEVMARAQAITAPSQWVANAISRGMLASPTTIYHGVDVNEWTHGESSLGYVLWNKARIDPVSDPADMQALARLLPDLPFVTTFGEQTGNVLPIGPKPFEAMRPIVQQAGVYLATARETFGIGTIEALAAGVPIAGWDYGGQSEIVIQGETGYLAPFGDLEGLAACVRQCLKERDRLSANAIADTRRRWGWEDKIRQYAELFDTVLSEWTTPRPKVSVIVTCYNLAKYLPDALESLNRQTLRDFDCIIVDDCSTDETPAFAADWTHKDIIHKYQFVRTPENLGLAGARNYGAQQARGKYILFLDADDMLEQNTLDTLSTALDRDPGTHIAYGNIETMGHDGTGRQKNPWPSGPFNWHGQMAHLNQLSYAAMMRREVLARSGGYRTRDWRAEDASFWSRVTSFGFRAAHVTDDATLIYRMHDAQKSRQEARLHPDRDGDWTSWLPWRIAGTAAHGLSAMDRKAQPPVALVPFAAQGAPPAPRKAWPVRHFQHPVVSIIIPVGPGHERFVTDALDSVQAQTMVEWECIVVNDTGKPLPLPAHPWAHVWDVNKINPDDTVSRMGPGGSRNWGLAHATAPFVLFLDADDLIVPRALEVLLKGLLESGGRYAYGDWLILQQDSRIDGPMDVREAFDYDQAAMLHGMIHPVTAVIPTEAARRVGGFDEDLEGFEDWDFYCKLAVQGCGGVRVAAPVLVYRRTLNLRTRTMIEPRAPEEVNAPPRYTALGDETVEIIHERYKGANIMSCGGCAGNVAMGMANTEINALLAAMTGGAIGEVVEQDVAQTPPQAIFIRMEYIGDQWGATSWRSEDGQRSYRAGRDPRERFVEVDPRDVARLEGFGVFQKVDEAILRAAAAPEGAAPAMVVAAAAQPSRVRGRRATQ